MEEAYDWIIEYAISSKGNFNPKEIPDFVLDKIGGKEQEDGTILLNRFTFEIGTIYYIYSQPEYLNGSKIEVGVDKEIELTCAILIFCWLEKLRRLELIDYEWEGDVFDKNCKIRIYEEDRISEYKLAECITWEMLQIDLQKLGKC